MPTITLDPAPPVQGQPCTIKYTGAPGTALGVEFTPPDGSMSAVVGEDGTVTIKIPDGATTILVTDEEGGADSVGDVIVPARAGARAKRARGPRKGRGARRS